MFTGYFAAALGMIFEAKNELELYLSSINPMYVKYTEDLWAEEVNSTAQLGNASVSVLHACGVKNPVHAGDIIAQSKATGKWSVTKSLPCVSCTAPKYLITLCIAFHLQSACN